MNLSTTIKSLSSSLRLFLSSTLLLTTFTSSVAAEELGRLFTTPKERAMLERMRHPIPTPPKQEDEPIVIVDHNQFKPPKSEVIDEDLANKEQNSLEQTIVEEEIIIIPAPDIPSITVNGFVKRSGGRSTAWVNGINTNDGYFEPQHIKVNPRRVGRDHVHVEVDDINIGEVSLKAGQTLNPNTAEITETYQSIGNTSSQ